MPPERALARSLTNFALGVGCVIIAACSSHRHGAVAPRRLAAPTPLPSGPVFAGARPARMLVDAHPLNVTPDGLLRFLVRARFVDARGAPTVLASGGDVAFAVERGAASVQWQTRMRFGGPAALVSFSGSGRATVAVRADVGVPLRVARVVLDTNAWRGTGLAGAALGPHAVYLGWFPRAAGGTVRVSRDAGNGHQVIGLVAAPASTFRDTSVAAGRRYRYTIAVPGRVMAHIAVTTPPQPAGAPLARVGGKAMWLSFSPSPLDPDAYTHLDPAAFVARARAAGIRAIELRVAYGAFREVTDASRATIDALVDAAARNGIAVLAWTVPRSTAFEDLETTVSAAGYRTKSGTRFTALAVDLERGDDFLGDGSTGYAALTDYLARVREALGPHYPIVATVEDPYLERLTERQYPYVAIAASADALQPMAYWRMLSKRATTPGGVRAALRGSYAATLREAGRRLPIDVGGQTSNEGPRGAPPPGEIDAAIDEAGREGALGITFFDWSGTSDAAWRAIAHAPWPRAVPERSVP